MFRYKHTDTNLTPVGFVGVRLTLPAQSHGPVDAGAGSSTKQQGASGSGSSRPVAKKPRTQEPTRAQASAARPSKAGPDKGKGRATGSVSDEESSTSRPQPHRPQMTSAAQTSRPATPVVMKRVTSDSRTNLLPFDSMRDEPNEQAVIMFKWNTNSKGRSLCFSNILFAY